MSLVSFEFAPHFVEIAKKWFLWLKGLKIIKSSLIYDYLIF